MTYLKFLFLLLSGFSLMKDCGTSQAKDIPEKLFNHWVHAHEEDKEDYRVFRLSTFEFPPSRGREGFEIKEDGTFIWHRIAPADGTEIVKGNWNWNETDSMLTVTFEENSRKELKIRMLEIKKDRIEIK